MFGQAGSAPKLLFPGLAGFYATVSDLWYPMIRVIAGGFLLYHGWGKLMAGVAPVAAGLTKYGIEPHTPLAYVVIFLETVGAICIIVGLFTRVFAPAIAIEMAIIAFVVKMPLGFGQMEWFLLWGIVIFAIALRGGGPYSLDHVIGKEL
jgi:putative oxidoreductase